MPGAWKLIIEDDAGKQIVVPFTRDVITIGRKEGNTIRLTERNVSRNHAKLSKDNGHVVIEDLGSFNGIKLNGDRIDGRVLVNEGDTIQIGDYHLAIHANDAAGASNGQQTVPANAPRSSTAAQPATADDDEFAGDTQRWEPPQGMQGISVQTLPTQEDRAVGSDERTVPAPHAGVRAQGDALAQTQPFPPAPSSPPSTLEVRPVRSGFGPDSGDTERVTLDMLGSADVMDAMKAGAPSARPQAELEPTVRQAVAPAPISALSAPSAVSGGLVSVTAETRPERPAPEAPRPILDPPRSDPRVDSRPEMRAPQPRTPPLPSVQDARGALAEQTEAVRPSPGAADETLPRLVVLNTIFAGSTFPLRTAEAVIGRTEDNDITIEHKSVSRNHAKIVREGDRVRILDLKSANGVLVNNEEVEQAVLRSGDVVELGRVRMRFVPIGERFVVPPDEIERARIADRAGDDFENDSGTGVTNPVRKKQQQQLVQPSGSFDTFPVEQKPKVLYIALAGIIALLIIAAVALVATSDDDAAAQGANSGVNGTKVAEPAPPDPVGAVDTKSDPKPDPEPKAVAKIEEPPPKVDDTKAIAVEDLDVVDEPDEPPPRADDPKPTPRVRPKRKVDADKNLKEASQALFQRRFDDAVRLSREVVSSPDATAQQKKQAQVQVELACKQAGASAPKACR